MRWLLLLLGVMTMSAADVDPVAVPFRLEYENGSLGIAPGEANELSGGVSAWYGGVHLHAASLSWIMSAYPGSDQALIEHLIIAPGPGGPDHNRLLIDSRESTLENFGFRGLLRPHLVTMERLPVDQAPVGEAWWHVVLVGTGCFAGNLREGEAWVPHGGWASEAWIDLAVAVGKPTLAPRCRSLHLFGEPAHGTTPRQRARLDRLRQPLADPDDLLTHMPTTAEFAVESMTITLNFDAVGRFESLQCGAATTLYGTPPQGLPMRTRSGLGTPPP